MYDVIELSTKKVTELKKIAQSMKIKGGQKLRKQDLIDAIVDHQKGGGNDPSNTDDGKRKGKRSRLSHAAKQSAEQMKHDDSKDADNKPAEHQQQTDRQNKGQDDNRGNDNRGNGATIIATITAGTTTATIIAGTKMITAATTTATIAAATTIATIAGVTTTAGTKTIIGATIIGEQKRQPRQG